MDREVKEKIEKCAINTLESVHCSEGVGAIDIIDVAMRLGFVVGNAVLNEEDDGFIVVEEGKEELMGFKTDKIIGVNSDRTLEWKRFIIAHELGHYIMHFKEENRVGLYAHRDHKRGHDETENEVDFFAASILMPRERFSNKFNELKRKDIEKRDLVTILANYFIVTGRMVERRIEELELA